MILKKFINRMELRLDNELGDIFQKISEKIEEKIGLNCFWQSRLIMSIAVVLTVFFCLSIGKPELLLFSLFTILPIAYFSTLEENIITEYLLVKFGKVRCINPIRFDYQKRTILIPFALLLTVLTLAEGNGIKDDNLRAVVVILTMLFDYLLLAAYFQACQPKRLTRFPKFIKNYLAKLMQKREKLIKV